MSKKTAGRAAAIAAALAKLSNSWDRRKQRQRDEAFDAMRKQIAESQLRERQYDEATRPTIEQKLADLERQRTASQLGLESGQYEFGQRKKEDAWRVEDRGYTLSERERIAADRKKEDEEKAVDRDYTLKSRLTPEQQQALNRQRVSEGDIDIETKTEALARSKRPKPVERRRIDEIAKSIGVGDEALREVARALEESGDDHGKAIESLSRPGPTVEGQDESIDTTNGADPRADGRLLLQRARREWAASGGDEQGGAPSPGAARKRTEAQVDAVSMRSAMQANAMIQNPQAPFEEKAQSWLTLERLGILKAPEEVKDWVRLGHKTPEQIAETQQAKGPPAQETRVPRPIKQGATTMAEDRAAIAERAQRRESDRMMARRTSGRPPEAGEIMDFLWAGKSRLAPTTGQMNNYPPENKRPVESRRIAGPPYAQPQIGPPYHGVDPEQSRQMDLDAFMQSQREAASQHRTDPIQVMADKVRQLRKSLDSLDPSTFERDTDPLGLGLGDTWNPELGRYNPHQRWTTGEVGPRPRR